jgi:hypothetical protein
MADITDWLAAQRDKLAATRDEAFQREDWATISELQPQVDGFAEALKTITDLRKRLAVFQEVILARIIVANDARKCPGGVLPAKPEGGPR